MQVANNSFCMDITINCSTSIKNCFTYLWEEVLKKISQFVMTLFCCFSNEPDNQPPLPEQLRQLPEERAPLPIAIAHEEAFEANPILAPAANQIIIPPIEGRHSIELSFRVVPAFNGRDRIRGEILYHEDSPLEVLQRIANFLGVPVDNVQLSIAPVEGQGMIRLSTRNVQQVMDELAAVGQYSIVQNLMHESICGPIIWRRA